MRHAWGLEAERLAWDLKERALPGALRECGSGRLEEWTVSNRRLPKKTAASEESGRRAVRPIVSRDTAYRAGRKAAVPGWRQPAYTSSQSH